LSVRFFYARKSMETDAFQAVAGEIRPAGLEFPACFMAECPVPASGQKICRFIRKKAPVGSRPKLRHMRFDA
jgi:hypothetical protein